MKVGNILFNWFDLVVFAVIAVGIFRGRRRGMSVELLDLFQWLITVAVAGLSYRAAGQALADYAHITPITGFLLSYLAVVILFRFLFGWIRRMVGEKLMASDVFGAWEYYLGMISGAIRFACGLIVAMAFLNGPYISPEQLAAQARMQKENFEDISFPTLGSLQQNVFYGSASGRLTKRYLARGLIVTTAADSGKKATETIGRQQERALSEILGEKR